MQINTTFTDPTGRYVAQSELLIRNVQAAFDLWRPFLADSTASIEVDFHLVTNYPNRGGGRSLGAPTIGTAGGMTVVDSGLGYELRTGIDPNEANADVEVFFDVDFLTQYYWINPLDGSTLPRDKNDLVYVIAHEIGHALGFIGYRDYTTLAFGGTFETSFDLLVVAQDGRPFFTGRAAQAMYGGPVPLTFGNVYHLGNGAGAGSEAALLGDLMNGVSFFLGRNYAPTMLDAAILSDLGVPTILGDLLRGTAGADTMNGGGGGDDVGGLAGNDSLIGGEGLNYLRGDEGNDTIVGGSGFDDANGNMGNDSVSTGAGEDYCVGGKDNDVLSGGDAYDLVYGNLGNDTCDGDAGNDIVRGGQDNDVVRGGAGDDFVSGDRGDDTMTGGAGADVFHTFGESGIDRVTDFSLAQGDRVQLDPGTQFTVAQSGADTVISMVGGGQMILVGVSMSTLSGAWIFGA